MAGGALDMKASNFADTILGEATTKTVADLARQLEAKAGALCRPRPCLDRRPGSRCGARRHTHPQCRSKAGVKVGDTLAVKRPGREIRDPATGKVLRRIEDALGTVTITEVDEASSVGKFTRRRDRQGRRHRLHDQVGPPMNFEIGSTVGDYQVVGILGAGGMGKVYKVRNVISDRIEAMKVLLPDLANEPELADRFLREIKVQASLEHPNIAALHTALRVENQLLMLMEFVEGVTLEQKLKDGPLPRGAGGRLHRAGALGARIRPRARRHPSRHQAGQHDADRRGRRQADGFRHRQSRRRPQADDDRHHHGLALLHVARADPGLGRRWTRGRTSTRWACRCTNW